MWTRGLEYHAYQLNSSLAVSLVQALCCRLTKVSVTTGNPV